MGEEGWYVWAEEENRGGIWRRKGQAKARVSIQGGKEEPDRWCKCVLCVKKMPKSKHVVAYR